MRSVLIVSSDRLFGRGLEALLRAQPELEVLSRECGEDELDQGVEKLQPDVVLVVRGDEANWPALWVERLLARKAGGRIIAVNLRDNCMWVYSGERREANAVRDLVKAMMPPDTDVTPTGHASGHAA